MLQTARASLEGLDEFMVPQCRGKVPKLETRNPESNLDPKIPKCLPKPFRAVIEI